MKDRIGFSIVLRGQLPVQSEAGTKGEVVSAKDSPGSSGCASDVSILIWSQSLRAFVHHREKALPSLVAYHLVPVTHDQSENSRCLQCMWTHTTSSEIKM